MSATYISNNVWQGSAPLTARDCDEVSRTFDALVLAAEEYQPSAELFPGVEVFHAPLRDDDSPTRGRALEVALEAAHFAARHASAGRRVLVTCLAGLNRSGYVSALALREFSGLSGDELVRLIQRKRPGALFNRHFVATLSRLPREPLYL